MSYAIRKDGQGYRAVNGPEDVGPDEVFSTERPDPVVLPVAIPPVSPRQIRQALTRAGLRSQVEAAVAAGDQDLKDWWEHSSPFERQNPQVIAMGQALGQTDAQLDGLWVLAASL